MRWEAEGIVFEVVRVARICHKIQQCVISVRVSRAGEVVEISQSNLEARKELRLIVLATSSLIFILRNEVEK